MAGPRTRSPGLQTAAVALIIALLAVVFTYALPSGARDGRDDLRCRTRLFRLSQAVIQWSDDNGRRQFPPITNPSAGQVWKPGRPGSISEVLGSYLNSDYRPIRLPDETDSAFRERQQAFEDRREARGLEREQSICPVTNTDYWYDTRLRDLNPISAFLGEVEQITVFRCQIPADGTYPHYEDGRGGVYQAVITGVIQMVEPEEVVELRAAIAQIKADHPDDPDFGGWDLPRLQRQLNQLEAASERARLQDPRSGGAFPVVHLEPSVAFEPVEVVD